MISFFRSLESSQERYLKTPRELHETIHRARSPRIHHTRPSNGKDWQQRKSPYFSSYKDWLSTPSSVPRASPASDVPLSPGERRPRRLTNELADRTRLRRLNSGEFQGVEWEIDDDPDRLTPLPLLPLSQTPGITLITGAINCWPRVQRVLKPRSYGTHQLVDHLQQLPENRENCRCIGRCLHSEK